MKSRSNPSPEHSYIDPAHYDMPYAAAFSSNIVAYSLIGVLSAYYLFQYLDYYPLLPPHEFLWNCLVHVTPDSLVSALDRRLKKTGARQGYPELRTFAAKSEAMRHLLGFHPGSALLNFQRPRRLSALSTVFTTSTRHALPGLGNWDNSCYQNSVLQGLASLPSVSAFLEQEVPTSPSDEAAPTREALRSLIRKLNDPSNGGKRLWTPAELKSMSSWQQQDAQEYFSKILDEIERETSRSIAYRPTTSGLLDLEDTEIRTNKGSPSCSHFSSQAALRVNRHPEHQIELSKLPQELSAIIVRNPLEGLLAQRVGCLNCGYVEGLSLIPFNCLTVPLGKQWSYQIEACLDEYTTLEHINGVECFKCTLLRQKQQLERLLDSPHPQEDGEEVGLESRLSQELVQPASTRLKAVVEALENDDFSENTLLRKCQIPTKSRVSTTKTRQAVIARAPKALVLHVNRSVFDELSGTQSKNYATVRFPQDLDLSPWCLGRTSRNRDTEMETWNTDPSKSLLPEIDKMKETEDLLYRLRAVVTHYGRHENGHYICYRESPRSDTSQDEDKDESLWWRLSDDEVSSVSHESVLSQGGVFMLFYEKVECSATKRSEQPNIADSISTKHTVDVVTQGGELEEDKIAMDADEIAPAHEDTGQKDHDLPDTRAITIDPAVSQTKAFTSPQTLVATSSDFSVTQPVATATSLPEETEDVQVSKLQSLDRNMEIQRKTSVNRGPAKETLQVAPVMRTSGTREEKDSTGMAGSSMASISSMISAN